MKVKSLKMICVALCAAIVLSGCQSMNNKTKAGFIGGGGGAFFTWRWQRKRAKAEAKTAEADAAKELQDVYQQLIADVKAEMPETKELIDKLNLEVIEQREQNDVHINSAESRDDSINNQIDNDRESEK